MKGNKKSISRWVKGFTGSAAQAPSKRLNGVKRLALLERSLTMWGSGVALSVTSRDQC